MSQVEHNMRVRRKELEDLLEEDEVGETLGSMKTSLVFLIISLGTLWGAL